VSIGRYHQPLDVEQAQDVVVLINGPAEPPETGVQTLYYGLAIIFMHQSACEKSTTLVSCNSVLRAVGPFVMERVEKTAFVSYRRTNMSWALAISQNLTHHGYDVFFDYNGIASGDFERVILENIKARAHFLIVLTPSALERCDDAADWLRREIETALASQRNIVPLMLEGLDFGTPKIASKLTGRLAELKHYNGLRARS
jgi:hypothetical protein